MKKQYGKDSVSLRALLREVFLQSDREGTDPIDWNGFYKETDQLSLGLLLLRVIEQKRKILVVLPNDSELGRLEESLRALGLPFLHFPGWGTALYHGIRSQSRTFAQRSAVLAKIQEWNARPSETPLVVLCALPALAPVLPPPGEAGQRVWKISVKDRRQPADLADLLTSFGYYRVPRVSLPGEYALRGEVLDFFPSEELPEDGQSEGASALRVVFQFDEIEAIKAFDPVTQSSFSSLESFSLFPLREVLWGEAERTRLRSELDRLLEAEFRQGNLSEAEWARIPESADRLLTSLAEGAEVVGEELLFPVAYAEPVDLAEYLGEGTQVICSGTRRLEQRCEALAREFRELHERAVADGTLMIGFRTEKSDPGIPPSFWPRLLPAERFTPRLETLRSNSLDCLWLSEFEAAPWPMEYKAVEPYRGNLRRFLDDLGQWLEAGYKAAVCVSSGAQRDRITHVLKDFIPPVEIFVAQFDQGTIFPKAKFVLIQEWEIFGKSGKRHLTRASEEREARPYSEVIHSFLELKEGDLIVHVNHGIGRFKKILRMSTRGVERDYLELEYEGTTLFVPIDQMNLVQRYIGEGDGRIKLDRIGGKSWQERKRKTEKSVEEMADRLLRLYSRRSEKKSEPFPVDDDLQWEFEADFAYEPTRDQLEASEEIKRDLESDRPMDRLLCGDVGFGKTEVAMRAAFKVANAGRQVILLCPTTILAEQHYQNFKRRFRRFPIEIGVLSRFVDPKKQREVLDGVERGRVDILIGTHRVLSRDVRFKDLGLIVIDEEQLFGVKDKEAMKLLKTSVDCLVMSSTPIPRTLHMSLVQIRDMSILKTPPQNRQPVETFVREFDPELIARAIRFELERGGQVFYLHNRIENLESVLLFLRELVPEAMIEMAHGRMESHHLEDLMYRFVHRGFQILLATTIIENGIDIPNVNTIIIDRADRYGIAQLYQLRGRVGRSKRLAYAYMFYPERNALSELAMKRLRIISDFTELGSGLKVAMKDLDVRGAGNLLGPQQSGNILAVGFEMYASLLAKAVLEQRQKNSGSVGTLPGLKEEIVLEIEYSGFIPDEYVPDGTEKIDLYRRLSMIDTEPALDEFYEEINDRFGKPPAGFTSLLSLVQVRAACRQAGVTYLKETQGEIELQFSKISPPPFEKIMSQLNRQPPLFYLKPGCPDSLFLRLENPGDRKRVPDEIEEDPLLWKTSKLNEILSSLL